ncbi:hypothetical protein [Cellulomonas phragmiteti]|uniref:Uncharacterized protein n=1 Tax=Cellulomonas phragmiteti TaxID=478780 RepID=A0ABQ4DNZ5_9CELL|nr:hypothetical protein [Cellulomonas phragmiteti]GIG40641.1 hypothetical protein Cph01nite_24030 [Cellulomonas phragmiteti]
MNRQSTSLALRIVGVAAFAVVAWRKTVTSDEPWWPSWLGALAVIGAIVLGVWWWTRRDDGTRRAAVAARPGWTTRAVWADATLGDSLRTLGATPGKVRGGTRMTLAWSATELQLWRGQTVVLTLPWEQVWTITRTVGQAASTGNPAVELVTRESARFVVVPARRPDGGMLPATGAQVDALVGTLREARQGSGTSVPPAR